MVLHKGVDESLRSSVICFILVTVDSGHGTEEKEEVQGLLLGALCRFHVSYMFGCVALCHHPKVILPNEKFVRM